MAAVTVTIRKYDIKTPTLVQTGSFTFTPASIDHTFGVRGITWDGAHLLLTTTRSTGFSASAAQLLVVDPNTFTLLDAYSINGLGSSRDVLDVAWHGAGMYAVINYVPDFIGIKELWALTAAGPKQMVGAKVLDAGITANSRGVAFDGVNIYVTSCVTIGGVISLDQYDRSGTKVKSFLMQSAGIEATGIIWDGAHIYEKHAEISEVEGVLAPPLARKHLVYNISPLGLLLSKFTTLGFFNTTEQMPIAFDGAFVYEFDSSL
jgi:hypothetical protein